MTFHTLEDKFNAMSKDIYGRFTNPGQIDTPIRPDASNAGLDIQNDSRALPIVSTTRDVKLVGKFLLSGKGLMFLGKQGFLQTGNTFAETRLYNPAGPLLHTVPFVHATRHISKGGKDVIGFLSSDRNDRGALQTETVGKVDASANLQARIQDRIKSIFSNVQQIKINEKGKVDEAGSFYQRPEDVAFKTTGPIRYATQPVGERGKPNPAFSTKKAAKDTVKNQSNTYSMYDSNWEIVKGRYKTPPKRSEIKEEVNDTFQTNPVLYTRDNLDTPKSSRGYGAEALTARPLNGEPVTFKEASERYGRSTFEHLGGIAYLTNGYLNSDTTFVVSGNGRDNTEAAKTQNGRAIGDFYNTGLIDENSQNITNLAEGRLLYDSIAGERDGKTDIIKFVFESVGSAPVYFRAFISSIKQNVKTEFNSQRYVGRNERFVTYGGATRTLALSFNIVAFSKNELDNMWLRVNYLTGLAFPKSVSDSGFMTPPLFKLTVGGLYDRQPCYIESLDFDFLDELITFDIDSEVSQFINVTMNVSLLEKRSRFHDSPFYAITEKAAANLSTSSERNKRADSSRHAAHAVETIRRNNPPAGLEVDGRIRRGELVFDNYNYFTKTPLEAMSQPAVQETSDKSTVTSEVTVVSEDETGARVIMRRREPTRPTAPQQPPPPQPSFLRISREAGVGRGLRGPQDLTGQTNPFTP